MPTIVIWEGARFDQLKQLWGAGLSASQIAREMHCTRNAVLGAAHRKGLADRTAKPRKPVVDMRKQRRAMAPARKLSSVKHTEIKIRPPVTSVTRSQSTVDVTNPLHITALNGCNCRWVVGEPANLMYCGAVTESEGASFCAAHANIAYIPTRLTR